MSGFDAAAHAAFLGGYLEAVGRLLTTGEKKYQLAARQVHESEKLGEILGFTDFETTEVHDWIAEFREICCQITGTDGRDKPTFYLIEYILWFREFSNNTRCMKIAPGPEVAAQSKTVYVIRADDMDDVLLAFEVTCLDAA